MAKTENKIFNNKNGYYTDEELLELKHMTEDEFIEFLRHYNPRTHKCPPLKYKMADCFYCLDCIKTAITLVKDKKVK